MSQEGHTALVHPGSRPTEPPIKSISYRKGRRPLGIYDALNGALPEARIYGGRLLYFVVRSWNEVMTRSIWYPNHERHRSASCPVHASAA